MLVQDMIAGYGTVSTVRRRSEKRGRGRGIHDRVGEKRDMCTVKVWMVVVVMVLVVVVVAVIE